MTKHIWHSPSCCYLQNIWCVSRFYFALSCLFCHRNTHTRTHSVALTHQITLFLRRAHSVFPLVLRYASPLTILWFPNESPRLRNQHFREWRKKKKENNFRIFIVFAHFFFLLHHVGLSIFKTQKSFSTLFCLAAIVVFRRLLLLLLWLWFAMLFALLCFIRLNVYIIYTNNNMR